MNTRVLLDKRPAGLPADDTWKIERDLPVPALDEGELLLEVRYISLDPAMRGWLRDVRSYIPPVQIGEVMRASVVGEIVESRHPHFPKGQHLTGMGGVQKYVATKAEDMWMPVEPSIAPLEAYLGTLGVSGLSAYFGLLDVGQPKEGETVLVSGAAGSVGSVVGQIAKLKGCRAVGVAGGQEKCNYVTDELGFDACVDYRAGDVQANIAAACTEGVDVYFDNVGGEILDAALTRLNKRARVVICGAISQYNADEIQGPGNYLSLLVNRARMEGFVVIDYLPRAMEALAEMVPWVAQGKLSTETTVAEGIEAFPATLRRLFSGEKRGKLVLRP